MLEFQEKLATLGIKHVQITLDGDQECHDQSRKLRNGKGSFQRIYENILTFCENIADSNLTLRVNCGDDNYASIERLLTRFPPQVRSRVPIFFRWIWANEATGYREFSCTARGSEPYRGLSDLYKTAKDLGWQTQNPINCISDGYCGVDFLDHYQIGPDGSVFLCSHTYQASDAIGSVLEGEAIRPDMHGRYVRWYAANPFDDPKCIKCLLLPVC